MYKACKIFYKLVPMKAFFVKLYNNSEQNIYIPPQGCASSVVVF